MMSEAKVSFTPDIQGWMRELRQSPERLDLGVRKVWREAAANVRDRARSRAMGSRPATQKTPKRPSSAGTHWKDLVNSIRSGATGSSPHVAIGADRVPWALGFEFGSYRYRQFGAWTGRGMSAGRFFWPTFRAEQPRVAREAIDALVEAYRRAYPE